MTNKEAMKKQYSYLDQINFQPYLDKYDDLYDIKYKVSDDYDGTEITQNDFLQAYIFNYMDIHELREYLEKRYYVKFQEVITYVK